MQVEAEQRNRRLSIKAASKDKKAGAARIRGQVRIIIARKFARVHRGLSHDQAQFWSGAAARLTTGRAAFA
jgi:hypothetical protein